MSVGRQTNSTRCSGFVKKLPLRTAASQSAKRFGTDVIYGYGGKGVRSGTSGQLPSHGGNRTCRHKEAANAIRCAHSLISKQTNHRTAAKA